jgi:Kef-type K+ transport system membrane component KefB
MPQFTNLLIIAAVALLAPLLLGYAPKLRVPAIVLEIVAGLVLGPSVLGWVTVDATVSVVAALGLANLLFLAGLEIDLHRLRGRTLRSALLGYAVTLVLGGLVGFGVQALGWTESALLVAIGLSATSLGLVIPVLVDARQDDTVVGRLTVAGATVADFAAIVALTLFFSMSGAGIRTTLVLLGVFLGLIVVVALVLTRAGRSMRLGEILQRLQDTTAEIRVRAAVLLQIAFVALASWLGLEAILGAFLAGAIVGLLDRDARSHPRFRAKLAALGYGFTVPVFFVASGVRLDLSGLLSDPSALLRIPLFLMALLVVRGIPALLYRRAVGTRAAIAAGLLQATSLPFLVTASAIGTATGTLSGVTAAALVAAGLLSVLLFPGLALNLLGGNDNSRNDGQAQMWRRRSDRAGDTTKDAAAARGI